MPGLFPKITGRRVRVTLLDVPESATDTYGQPTMEPVLIDHFWAEITPILSRGRELVAVKQVYPTATHVVRMNWLGDAIPSTPDNPYRKVLTRMKLIVDEDGTVLNIVSVALDNLEANRQWVMVCQEREGATT